MKRFFRIFIIKIYLVTEILHTFAKVISELRPQVVLFDVKK